MVHPAVFRRETLVAANAVEQAMATARARTGAGDVRLKGPHDVVTGTDIAVEDQLRELIGREVGLPIVGEERGGVASAHGGAHWLVDPICGTRNFASGIPLYCTNVALVEDGSVTVAVVGDPSAGELWVAELDAGAWAREGQGWRPIRADDGSATIVIEGSHLDHDPARRARVANGVAAAIRAFRWDIRAFSTTLALPYVATGRVAAYVLFSASALHAGAGSLLAAEAGAVVTDVDGRPWTLASDSLLAAATPQLHHDLLEIAAAGGDA